MIIYKADEVLRIPYRFDLERSNDVLFYEVEYFAGFGIAFLGNKSLMTVSHDASIASRRARGVHASDEWKPPLIYLSFDQPSLNAVVLEGTFQPKFVHSWNGKELMSKIRDVEHVF
eukprot:IDg11462t1